MKTNIQKYIGLVILLMLVLGGYNTSAYAESADSLNHYLKIAAENNPEVRSAFLSYKAALERVPQSGAYQDPELEMGFFLKPMDIVGGRQVSQFKLMQMFPWFGTKKSAQTEATHRAQMAYEQFRETRNNMYLSVYSQWYMLLNLRQQLNNNRENKRLLKQLEELAIRKFSSPTGSNSAGYSLPSPTSLKLNTSGASTQGSSATSSASSTGGGMSGMGNGMSSMQNSGGSTSAMGGGVSSSSTAVGSSANSMSSGGGMSGMGSSSSGMSGTASGMSDVLRIQIEMAEIDNNIESLLSEIKAETATFNALLNRAPESGIQLPESILQISFRLDEPSLINEIKAQNPTLNMILEEGLSYEAKAKTDKKMGYPMFGIGVQYMLNKKTNDKMLAMGDMNGKDMVMPMVSVSIPLYRNKYKAMQRETRFMQEANKEKYANTLNSLEAELYTTRHQLEDAERKIMLYDKQKELAQSAYSLVVREYILGGSDLNNVIQVERQLLDYQLKRSEAIAGYNTMVATMQKLISFNDSKL